jgi:hypothetical protein
MKFELFDRTCSGKIIFIRIIVLEAVATRGHSPSIYIYMLFITLDDKPMCQSPVPKVQPNRVALHRANQLGQHTCNQVGTPHINTTR